MTQDFRNQLMALRGAPVTCLVALLCLQGQAGTAEISDITGYSQPTVTRACQALAHQGLITRAKRYQGWLLSSGGLQLPLAWAAIDLPDAANQKIFASLPTTTTLINDDIPINKAVVVETSQKDFASPDRLQALADCGIGEPTRTKLALLEWATPEYIQAIAADLKRQGKAAETGLLVHRIASQDPQPALQVDHTDGRAIAESWKGYLADDLEGE